MATTVNPASVVVVNESNSFPTGAIVIIALGGYMLVFAILLLIRKCIVDKGGTFCPVWCSEACACQTCCNDQPNDDTGCYASLARACDCNMPNKRQCMDTVCPTKQRCNDMFCSCFSQPSNEDCCKSCSSMGDCNWCGDCGDCCNCNDCKDCCGDCECSCCSQPDSINCCCLESSSDSTSDFRVGDAFSSCIEQLRLFFSSVFHRISSVFSCSWPDFACTFPDIECCLSDIECSFPEIDCRTRDRLDACKVCLDTCGCCSCIQFEYLESCCDVILKICTCDCAGLSDCCTTVYIDENYDASNSDDRMSNFTDITL